MRNNISTSHIFFRLWIFSFLLMMSSVHPSPSSVDFKAGSPQLSQLSLGPNNDHLTCNTRVTMVDTHHKCSRWLTHKNPFILPDLSDPYATEETTLLQMW